MRYELFLRVVIYVRTKNVDRSNWAFDEKSVLLFEMAEH